MSSIPPPLLLGRRQQQSTLTPILLGPKKQNGPTMDLPVGLNMNSTTTTTFTKPQLQSNQISTIVPVAINQNQQQQPPPMFRKLESRIANVTLSTTPIARDSKTEIYNLKPKEIIVPESIPLGVKKRQIDELSTTFSLAPRSQDTKLVKVDLGVKNNNNNNSNSIVSLTNKNGITDKVGSFLSLAATKVSEPLSSSTLFGGNGTEKNSNKSSSHLAPVEFGEKIPLANKIEFYVSDEPVEPHINGLFWIPIQQLTDDIKEKLTVKPNFPKCFPVAKDATLPVKCWIHQRGAAGIPVHFATKHLGLSDNKYPLLWKLVFEMIPAVSPEYGKRGCPYPWVFELPLRDADQRNAVQAFHNQILQKHCMGIKVMPCGYGKTVVALKCASDVLTWTENARRILSARGHKPKDKNVDVDVYNGDFNKMMIMNVDNNNDDGHDGDDIDDKQRMYDIVVYAKSVLIICPNTYMDGQWTDECKRFIPRAKIAHFGGGKQDDRKDAHIVIATIQTLMSKFERWSHQDMMDFFSTFAMVVCDEAHHMAAKGYSQIFQCMPYERVLGVTATPNRRDGKTCLLEWYFGEIFFKIIRPKAPWVQVLFLMYHQGIRETRIYDEGFFKGKINNDQMEKDLFQDSIRNMNLVASCLQQCQERMQLSFHPNVVKRRMPNIQNSFLNLPSNIHDRIASFLPMHDIRQNITNVSQQARCTYNRRHILVFVKYRRHAHILRKMIHYHSKGTVSISTLLGRMEFSLQDKAKESQIVIATVAMVNEAFNLPSLDTGMVTCPQGEMEQISGRILRPSRLKFPVRLIDMVDTFGMYLNRAQCRHFQYAEEFGFTCMYQHLAPACESIA